MMGPQQVAQGALFYEFNLDAVVPGDHLLRSIDRFVDLAGVRGHLTVSVDHLTAERRLSDLACVPFTPE